MAADVDSACCRRVFFGSSKGQRRNSFQQHNFPVDFSFLKIYNESKKARKQESKKAGKGISAMLPKENTNTEFKEIYTSGVKKEVVAFANTDGGTVYICLLYTSRCV